MKCYHICNPENRRARFVREALERLQLAPAIEISWKSLLEGEAEFRPGPADVIRIESPGENFDVERLLIERGGGPRGLTYDRGRLYHQVAWYAGLVDVLGEIKFAFPGARFMNHPDEIAAVFDKYSSQQHLKKASIPVPEVLGRVESFDHLVHLMESTSSRRIFLKPCHSSSASGVVAIQTASPTRILATTSANFIPENSRIYNSLKLRRYRDPLVIRLLVDQLCQENVFAEKWFPKDSINGKVYDLRVLLIAGRARHVVVRTSQSPITNLHLGNERGVVEELKSKLGREVWEGALKTCEQAAAAFPKCHYIAVDLMISSSQKRFAVAEVNAFGDLIPNVISEGDDTYTAEFRSFTG